MARQELQRRLEELDMTQSEARRYGQLLNKTQAYMHSLHSMLECRSLSSDHEKGSLRNSCPLCLSFS